MESYDQLRKFIADLSGKKKKEISDEVLNQNKVEAGNVTIELALGEKRAGETTDYQKRIIDIIKDKDFRDFSNEDLVLGDLQRKAQETMKFINDPANSSEDFRTVFERLGVVDKAELEEKIEEFKRERKTKYVEYIAKSQTKK